MVIAELVMSSFTFSFWVELLVVVPVASMLVLLTNASRVMQGAESAYKMFSCMHAVFGWLMLGFAIYRLIHEVASFVHLKAFYSLLLPFILSLFYLPLLYLLCAWIVYERVFLRLPWGGKEAKRLLRYKRWRLIRTFALRINDLRLFCESRAFSEFRWATRKEEADSVIYEFLNSLKARRFMASEVTED